jgi:hypothetical protein
MVFGCDEKEMWHVVDLFKRTFCSRKVTLIKIKNKICDENPQYCFQCKEMFPSVFLDESKIESKSKIISNIKTDVWEIYFRNIYQEGLCFICNESIYYDNYIPGIVNPEKKKTLNNYRPICKKCSSKQKGIDMSHFKYTYYFQTLNKCPSLMVIEWDYNPEYD